MVPKLRFSPIRRGSGWRAASHHNAYEYDERHAISDSALANLLAKPHDEGRAGSQGQNGHEHKARARMVDQGPAADIRALQRGGNGGGLDNASTTVR